MSDAPRDTPAPGDLHGRGRLERHFIAEYLRGRGVDPHRLHAPPEEGEKQWLAEAARYASAKLMEIEAEARLVHRFHEAGGTGHSPTRV